MYSRKVLIKAKAEILPQWLRFVKGPSSTFSRLGLCGAHSLTPQANPGSLYRCRRSTFKRAACGPRLEERSLTFAQKNVFFLAGRTAGRAVVVIPPPVGARRAKVTRAL